MARTILVAGKDMPACSKYADGLVQSGRQVVVCEPDVIDDEDVFDIEAAGQRVEERHKKMLDKASGIATVPWNRGSPISARTLILNAESVFERIDDVVLYFDEELYASRANQVDIEECSQGCSDMILAYQYLTLEVLKRFKARKTDRDPGSLVFLLKEGPSAADAVRAPSLRNGAYSIASPVVAAAATAFMAFAENIVALYGDMQNINVLMVRGDKSMDIVANETSLAKWTAYYVDALAQQKAKGMAKKSLAWIRPGTKFQKPGFSLLNRKG